MRSLFLIGVLLVTAAPGVAQSVLTFPRVISDPNIFTGIAVGNPTSGEVSVTFTAFQPDGSVASGNGIRNPATLTIPAGGQLARQFGEIFGGTGTFNGWVQATSSVTGLTGFFLNGNNALTDLDGAGSVSAASELILPFAVQDSVAKTEVTLVNVNTDAAATTLVLYASDGDTIASKNLTLAGRGLIRQTLSTLFGSVDFSEASHIRIRSDRPVVTHEVVADYLISGSSLRRETLALSGQLPTSAQTYVLPQFVTGGGWLSLVGFVNAGGVAQDITITAYKEDGTLWQGVVNPKRITLDANAGLRIPVGDLFGFPSATLSSGWLEVKSSLGFLTSYIGYGTVNGPSFAAVAGTDAGSATKYAAFSHVAEGAGFFTGLTAVNPGKDPATVEFYTLRPDGTTVGRTTFTIGPNQRVGKLFSELLPAALDQVGGWGFVRSSQPIIAAVLFGGTNGYALANVPQQVPASDYLPPAQITGSISGSVRAAGQPIADVQITLSGPVSTTRMTDGSGRFVFSQLPKGDYLVRATRIGAQIVPAERTVAVDRSNVDGVNFEAGGLTPADVPFLTGVSPSATFAGSQTFSIRLLGNSFTPFSVVKLNEESLTTTFVSSTELQAVLTQAQLASPRTANILVETAPPGGGRSAQFSFVINPATSSPLIEGRVATGGNPSGVAFDAKRERALVTNQSSDTVSVVDLKTLRSVASIKVGRSPAEGIAISADRDMALVANPGSNDVSVIDLASNTEIKRIAVGDFPLGIAIDDSLKRAYVANRLSNNISVIDLGTLTELGKMATSGTAPSNIAINPKTHVGIITNRDSDNATFFDAATNTVSGTVTLGQRPRGVAINPDTNQAVIANANGNDVWIIDLASRSLVATVPVGAGPTGVAIHKGTNTAVVTNSSVTRTQQNFGVLGSISIINLGSREVSEITVGPAAFGVDVDETNQRAIVADFGSDDITVVRIPNPRPRVDDTQPRTFPVGGGSFTLTVRGTGFLPSSVVSLNGVVVPAAYVSPTELRVQVPVSLLDQILRNAAQAATGGQVRVTVTVFNSGPGGGDSTVSSASQIQPENAAPVLLSISPNSIQAGISEFTLTFSGNNFNPTTIILFGGSPHSPGAVSPTSMSVNISGTELVPGTMQVSIINPAPGGGVAGPLPFTVDTAVNPAPSVSSVDPPSIPAGSSTTRVTVQGTGFLASTSATLGGVSGTVSGNTITFDVTAAPLVNPTTLSGLISNPKPGGGSATFSVNVLNPQPTITGFSPATAAAGSPSVTIEVTGTNLRNGSQITVEGTPVPTVFISSTQVSGAISGGFLRRPGDVTIGVMNPPPGGGAATAGLFRITSPIPTLNAISPSSVAAQSGPITLTLSGSGFAGNASVSVGGVGVAAAFDSATTLIASVPASLVQHGAFLDVVVSNPAPGGGTSQPVRLSVMNPAPALSSISPDRMRADAQNVVLTATGANFVDGSVVSAGGIPLQTTFVSPTQLTAALVPPLPLGRVQVIVTTQAPGGGVSGAFEIEITPLPPTITNVSPLAVSAGGQIHVTGTNLGPGSIALLGGVALATSVTSNTELVATIAAGTPVGPASIIVRNPASQSSPALDSNSVSITILNPTPAISSLNPASAQIGTTVTIGGQNFMQTSVVSLNGSPVGASFVDAATLTFVVSGGTPSGSVSVQVTNPAPGGGASNIATLTVTSPPPALNSITPSSGTAGAAVTLVIDGSNFELGAEVNFAGTAVATQFTTANSLTAFVTLPTIPGDYPVTVMNPGNVASNSLNFTVNAQTPAPTITQVQPNSGNVGTAVNVTITGTNFVAGQTTVQVSGAGVTVGAVNVSGTTSISMTFTIAANAATGARNVTVTTPNGTSVAATFTVTANVAATHFAVSAPAAATGGVAFNFTVTALDQFNNTATGYAGTVHFTSSDGTATLPANATLTNGVGTFSATLRTGGSQTITATDTVTATITGTSNAVTVSAGGATRFTVAAPAAATGGVAFNFTVTALDQFNNTATGYTGTVHFTSSDGTATLPANATLTNGVGTFSATLRTVGSQTITATDTVTATITGTSNAVTVSAGGATHFTVAAPAAATGGVAFNFTVTALDQFNNTATGYTGTVHFTSSDGTATLPANATLTNGVGTFSATLRTGGSQTITATDTVTATNTGTSNAVTISAGGATHFTVAAPAAATGGVAFNFTVTALDQFNNTATGYTGTVHFTSSDGTATLPANATLTNGVGTFSATLRTVGSQTITATDTVTATITGTSNAVTVSAGGATHFTVAAPAAATGGVAFNFTVTALDQFNNTATGYTGTVHFTSSDGTATLPANATLTNGVGTFSATLRTGGSQTITATDTVTATITGTSNAVTVSAGGATHFTVSAPAAATGGVAFNFTVTALDQFNNTATGYTGTVHFTSSDGTATLPANATLTNGVGTFSATLRTGGSQTITATDTVTATITGASNGVTVSAGGATHFTVAAPAAATGGVAFNFTVTALDQFNNTATGYTGTVHFTSSDGTATLPANATLTNGVGTFSATLRTVGNQTITATDTVTATITGASNGVTVSAGTATHFTVAAPASATGGVAFNFTVTALDQFNNTATGYTGTVHFTSSDGTATLPANATLTNGVGTFSATLRTGGSQTITATDTVTATITGTSNGVTVSAGTATHFTVSAPAAATGGVAFNFTVTALDQFNNTATGYTGTVHFTSSDGTATLPANATLTNGVGTFSATLRTGGNQTITVADTVNTAITGTSSPITVSVPLSTHFAVSVPASVTAGSAFNFTVTALDQFNNTATGYAGTVHFTSSDGTATLPANATLTNGVGTFSATLRTSGSQTITATDTVNAAIAGSNTVTVNAGAATHFTVSAPAAATGGVAFNFTVTALDQFNNTATGYAGTVHFTSSDGTATLPANATLTNGVGTFSATLRTSGSQTITVTDTVTAAITGTSNGVTVSAGGATHFAVAAPVSATGGVAFNFTVTALDQFNNTATGYTGTVHFTSSDGSATLPANATLTNGVGTFSATLRTAGSQTITATDTVTATITGTSNAVTVSAGGATHFTVSAPAAATGGVAFNFTVTALDQFNNTAAGYTGTVHFTSSDGTATLPVNATLTNGVGTFSATLRTGGSQTITATDTVTATITGTSNAVTVSAGGATHFAVSAPAAATGGVAFNFTVTALDQFNNTATGYTGTVHFTSSDGTATLPANATLTNGVGTFPATLRTSGSQTITATDTVTAAITGTSNGVTVSAGGATHFTVAAPAAATGGVPFNFTVTALDQFNNTATGYAGTVHFTSSDGTATLPANATLTNGVGTFSATLRTVGSQTITASDTVTATITGTSNAVTVSAGGATHFAVSAPASATGGVAFNFTVTALDQFNNTATGYTGTVHFTSSDGTATLPANTTLTNGVGTFSATLRTSGSQTITASDTVTATIAGTSNAVTVSVGSATHFAVSAPAAATGGVAFNFTVTALDQFNNTATGYTGTVHFTSSDGNATLPANATLTNGVGTFSATLRTVGSQTITATDTVTATITGTSNAVTVSAGGATHFAVSAPAAATGGVPFNFTVTALDQFNNPATGYTGTVHFTSSDGTATLPANATLTNGVGTFSATLRTSGSRTITATDTVNAAITGTSNAVTVSAGAATHFAVSAPGSVTGGVAFNFTVTALDQFNNPATGYAGTVHFTSSDGTATLPANATLTNGVGTFSATLRTSGSQTVTATDTVNAAITGTSNAVTVNPAAFTVTSVAPDSGSIAGGTLVFITGTNFTGNSVQVKFGTTFGMGARIMAPTLIGVFTPPHVAGLENVSVTLGSTQTLNNAFTFTSGTLGSSFFAAPSMASARGNNPAAAVRIDGTVIVTGGTTVQNDFTTTQSSTEIAALLSLTFSNGPNMAFPRAVHTATALADGRTFIAGGVGLTTSAQTTSEILDVAAAAFTSGPSLGVARAGHTATLLPDGRVLIAGGVSTLGGAALQSAEVFDPLTNTMSSLIQMNVARSGHQATLLFDGTVLITGGGSRTAELFNPSTNVFTTIANLMLVNRVDHRAALMTDGRVLLTGGNVPSVGVTNSTEIYSNGAFTGGGNMTPLVYAHSTTLLGDGKVLIAGGFNGTASSNAATMYDPAGGGTFTNLPNMINARRDFASVRLLTGGIYFAGGNGSSLSTAEVFGAISSPIISALIPAQRTVNSGAFRLDVLGNNFVSGADVEFGGAIITGNFIDSQHMFAQIPAQSITNLGSINVRVRVPDPLNAGAFMFSPVSQFNVVNPAITLSPNPVNVSIGATFPVTVSVNQAPAAPISITVTSANPNIVSVVGSPAVIPANQTSTTINVTGVAVGNNIALTASLTGYTSGATAVNVAATAAPTVSVTPPAILLNAAGSDTITVSRANSSNAVPLDVTLSVNGRAGFVSVPALVTIPATQSSIVVPINGIAPDPTPPVVISASAPSHLSGTNTQVTVQIQTIQMTPALLVNPGSSANLIITLSAPAGSNGLTVNLVSSATGVATVPASVFIPSGQTQVLAPVTGVTQGNAVVTATATGFPPIQSQIQVQNINMSFVPGAATFFSGPNYAQPVGLIMSVPAVASGQTVNLTSSDPSIVTAPPSVIIPSGSTIVNVTITGVGPGTATITASSPGLNNGIFTATIIAPTLRVNDNESFVDTATGIRRRHYVRIPITAPIGGVPVTITSSDPTRLLVAPCDPANANSSSCVDTNPPQPSATFSIPTGQNFSYFDAVGQDLAQDEVRFQDPFSVARDSAGNIYIADFSANVIRKIDGVTGLISTFAGTGVNSQSGDGGQASAAAIGNPISLAVYQNELYISSYSQGSIRKITLGTGVITTAVASGTLANPYAIAFNQSNGDLFIAALSNSRVYRFSSGVLSVYAGGGALSGLTVGVQATQLSMGRPAGVAVDSSGNVYYSDFDNHLVNQIATNGLVARVMGNGTCGVSADVADAAANGLLCNPTHMAYDPTSRFLYVSSRSRHRIERITLNAVEPSATVRPAFRIAGDPNGGAGCCGDGLPSRSATLNTPDGLMVDPSGNLWVADRSNRRLRQIDRTTGIIDTVAGSGQSGSTGDGLPARGVHLIITSPTFITTKTPVDIDQSAWTLFSLNTTQTIGVNFSAGVRANNTSDRMANPTSVSLSSVAGAPFNAGAPIDIPINGTSATFNVTPTATGNGQLQVNANGTRFNAALSSVITVLPVATAPLRIDDGYSPVDTAAGIRRRHFVRIPSTAPAGGFDVTIQAQGAGVLVSPCDPANGNNSACVGTAGSASATVRVPQNSTFAYFDVIGGAVAATDTRLSNPADIAVAANGDIYVADYSNYRVRKLSNGVLSTVAGSGGTSPVFNANPLNASMRPIGVTLDAAGNLYIADDLGHVVYQLSTGGVLSVIAGAVNQANFVEGALGANRMSRPWQVAFGPDGSIYIADFNNQRVRKITATNPPNIPLNGTMTTIAGGGNTTPANGVAATSANLGRISGVAVDPIANELYLSDYDGHRVWKLALSGTTAGQLVLIAGTGTGGYNGDQADATTAQLNFPRGLNVRGNFLYIAERSSNRVRRVTTDVAPRPLVTVAGTTSAGFDGDGDAAVVAHLNDAFGVTTDAANNVYIADFSNQRVRMVSNATGVIDTLIGNGFSGFAGDGGSGRGTTITATAVGGQLNGQPVLPATVGIENQQSQWQITGLTTTQVTSSTFQFNVRPNNGSDRMAANTTFDLVSTAPSVFTVPPQQTLNNNLTNLSVTATALSQAGNGQIQILPTGTTFVGTTSAVITVLPTAIAPMTIDDGYTPVDTATGVRRRHFVRIPSTAPAGGFDVTIQAQGAGALVSPCDPANGNNSACVGTAGSASATVRVPQNSTFAYFDVIGGAVAATDTRLSNPADIAVAANGDIYVADYSNYRVRKLSNGVLSTVAGSGGTSPVFNANPLNASMRPIGVTLDAAGNLYIADDLGHVVYQLSTGGVLSVIAGAVNQANFVEGALGANRMSRPWQVAFGPDGSIYIADFNNQRVRKITATNPPNIPLNGTMTTIAGGGNTTPANGVAATSANLGRISGVAVDPIANELYLSDYDGHRVWKLALSGTTAGQLVLIAGTGTGGYNGDQADATTAQLNFPRGLNVRGNFLYIAERSSNRVRRVTTDVAPRPLVTVAGSTSAGFSGDGDAAIVARLNDAFGVTSDSNNNLYIADFSNHRVRMVSNATGVITTLIGNGSSGFAGDGGGGRGTTITATAVSGQLNGQPVLPVTVGVDDQQSQWAIVSLGQTQTTGSTFQFTVRPNNGSDRMASNTTFDLVSTAPSVFTVPGQQTLNNNLTNLSVTATALSQFGNGQIQIQPTGTTFLGVTSAVVTVLPPALPAITLDDTYGPIETATGVRQRHYVRLPVTVPVAGPPVQVNITSSDASRAGLSLCDPNSPNNATCTGGAVGAGITVTVPVNSNFAYFDLVGLTTVSRDTRLSNPSDVAVASNGDIYFADYSNFRVRKLSNGVLTTVAGNGNSPTLPLPGATALQTPMRPIGITLDSANNLYIADDAGHVIYQVTPAGAITLIAGAPLQANFANGALGTNRVNRPWQVALGADGSIYIADFNNGMIRKITATSSPNIPLNGTMTTIAGGGATTPATGVTATAANFGRVSGVAVDPATNDVYLSDYDSQRVWKVPQSGAQPGQLELIAGTGTSGYNGDSSDATLAQLATPRGLSFRGNFLYIADSNNHRIRRVTTNLTPRPLLTVAGTTSAGFSGDGDLAIIGRLNTAFGITTDSNNNLYIADFSNHRVRFVANATGVISTIIGNGTSGFAGDGLPGRGTTITAAVAAGGPSYAPVTVGADIEQSTWQITGAPSTTTGPTFTFNVQQTSPIGGGMRMNSATTFFLTPNSPNVFTLPASATIANNATGLSPLATATTVGAGTTQIIAQASATGIAIGASGNITVNAVFTSVSVGTFNRGSTTSSQITGRNLSTATGITVPAGSGIVATIVNAAANGTTLDISVQVPAGESTGTKALNIQTPSGAVSFNITVQ